MISRVILQIGGKGLFAHILGRRILPNIGPSKQKPKTDRQQTKYQRFIEPSVKLCFFGESLFSGKTTSNLMICSELLFEIFVGSLSTGSYRVAKGQHHHLLESLVGFTSTSRKYLQMAQIHKLFQITISTK